MKNTFTNLPDSNVKINQLIPEATPEFNPKR